MNSVTVSRLTARRFILGRQGLWPGRRWRGIKGTMHALQTCEAIQEDPLSTIARSHDIALYGRVLDYKPRYLEQLMYKDRLFFDYGGLLSIYPMSEMPYWRVHMHARSLAKRVENYIFTHNALFERVRLELRDRGPLGNRDLRGSAVSLNYRGRKDSSLALFDMWISGELMIHHRNRFERVYDFREKVVPAEFEYMASQKEAEEFFARKCIAHMGLMREGRWKTDLQYYIRRKIGGDEMKERLRSWTEQGVIAQVRIGGSGDKYIVLAEDLPYLESLERGKVPRAWRSIGPTTQDEVVFFAPLEIVSARGRAKRLFDFEYLWEVYKPVSQRRWGYYTLPILYGDDLVARLDPKLNRTTRTLEINGFWQEDDAPVQEPEFAAALAKGLIRFARFLDVGQIDLSVIRPVRLRKEVLKIFGEASDIVVV
jgi:uncharacterized protein